MSGGCVCAVFVGNDKYVHKMRNSMSWWGQDFIHGFIAMTQHNARMFEPKYKNDDRILMVYGNYCQPETVLREYRDATHLCCVILTSQNA